MRSVALTRVQNCSPPPSLSLYHTHAHTQTYNLSHSHSLSLSLFHSLQITADELLAYLVSVQPSAANVEGMVEKLFALIDDDNSGAISSGELHSFLVEKLGWSPSTLSIEDVEKIIDEIDDDGDDHISQAELKAFLIKHSR